MLQLKGWLSYIFMVRSVSFMKQRQWQRMSNMYSAQMWYLHDIGESFFQLNLWVSIGMIISFSFTEKNSTRLLFCFLCLPLICLSCGSFKIRYRVSYLRALLKFYFVMSWIDLQLISSETLCRVYRQNMINLSPGYKWGDQHSFKDSRYLLDSNKLLHTGVDSLSSCYC